MHFFIDKDNQFSDYLIDWYSSNKRNLAWRETKDPYKIWLSEIILQQTRVAQGTSYYLKFIKNYPSVADLANATEEEVLKDWQGLGYYSRARNLHSAAKFIAEQYDNEFPSDYNSIKALKGVGDYTAAAIASFAFKLPYAVVDGNVYRVLSRIFGIETPIDSTKGKKEFAQLAQQLLNPNRADDHNQAIMEFGALQCIPKNPNCSSCVFQEKCQAFNLNKVDFLPLKEKKLKQKTRFLNYLIIETETEIVVNKRDSKGIWQNLYDFPLVETNSQIDQSQLILNQEFKKLNSKVELTFQALSESRKHILSHQILIAQFFHFYTTNPNPLKQYGFEVIEKKNLSNLPIPKLIENYLNEETNLLSLFER